ncbi:hypothetical protein [Pseudoxanthomonas sacheonensis]|uniref:Lipoprotein SmpA/OmlA domain-containing protein n=1 Tax=Pseudoxanthomonas sacheonensis TaxID=443615 RepID=A0ABU1RVD4_9GAMM|nr:hypothetical protein [Pseudoxanthomonas sacheonensis]MDR6842743.1 hypothetical protein [Pseudoxanthomonas sacheonensis]
MNGNYAASLCKRLPILFAVFFGLAIASPLINAKEPSVAQKYDRQYVRANLVKGKTTPDEVKQKFGKPHEVETRTNEDGDYEDWIYIRSEEGARGLFNKARNKLSAVSGLSGGRGGTSTADNALETTETKANIAGDLANSEKNGSGRPAEKLYIHFKDGVLSSFTLQ